MRVKFEYVQEGPGPSEQVVQIRTVSGSEQLVVSTRKIEGSSIDIGEPLIEDNSNYLIELPRETASGRWRVWVAASQITNMQVTPAE
jgi:hypothetical protein